MADEQAGQLSTDWRNWRRKLDALIAAVMELDDAQRDRILARAKELEAEN